MMEEGRLLISALVPDGKDWVDVFAALATPIIAALALMFAYKSYLLERRRREDNLHEKRYTIFEEFRRVLMAEFRDAGTDVLENERLQSILHSFAARAEFLFPVELSKEIRSLSVEDLEKWALYSWANERDIVSDLFLPYMRYRK